MWTRNFLKFFSRRVSPKPVENMASLDALQRLETCASEAESLISMLKAEVSELQKVADFCKHNIQSFNVQRFEEIQFENEKLKKEIDEWKVRLTEAEKKLGILPVQVPPSKPTNKAPSPTKQTQPSPQPPKDKLPNKKNKDKPSTADENKTNPSLTQDKKPENKSAPADDLPVHVGRLDIRVGKIISVKKHPDADSLYVEEVDLGEGKPRTVVSGLVKYVPIEHMENRMVVALCNLKPAKMRGVTSEAMVLCASTPDKVEVLAPPEGSRPGDKVVVEGYPSHPDPVLNPKKKIFETVAPDLKTDSQRTATYKGTPLTVPGRGTVTAETLTEVQIK